MFLLLKTNTFYNSGFVKNPFNEESFPRHDIASTAKRFIAFQTFFFYQWRRPLINLKNCRELVQGLVNNQWFLSRPTKNYCLKKIVNQNAILCRENVTENETIFFPFQQLFYLWKNLSIKFKFCTEIFSGLDNCWKFL